MLATQLCPTLCDPMNCRPPGSSVHGILQARILEWVATPFSRGSSQPGIKSRSPALQVDSLPSEPPGSQAPEGRYLMENGNISTVFLHKVSSTGDLADNLKKKKKKDSQ